VVRILLKQLETAKSHPVLALIDERDEGEATLAKGQSRPAEGNWEKMCASEIRVGLVAGSTSMTNPWNARKAFKAALLLACYRNDAQLNDTLCRAGPSTRSVS
jgi:hypothetical protein